MGYLALIIAVVAIVIIAFVFGNDSKNGRRISFSKSFSGLIGRKGGKINSIMDDVKKYKENVLEIIIEETTKQNQLSGTVTHLGEDIRGVTEHTIEKKSDIPDRLIGLCLHELEREKKIRCMKLSGATKHYVLAE